MTKIQESGDKVVANVERVIVGKHHEVRLALVALLCRGHLLIEDVPGTGKTVLAKAIARSLGCIVPADPVHAGPAARRTSPASRSTTRRPRSSSSGPGPIMAQIVLADEINRATPKTQSALLECMEERQVTIDGTTYPMPDPFLVIATQNPIEYEGTFALPEAQLDRFMLRLRLGYPQPLEEIVILDEQKRDHPLDELEEVASVEELRAHAGGRPRDLRRLASSRLHRPAGQRHPRPPRRLPRRLAARLAGALPGRPGVGRPPGARLRHPRRRQGPRRAGPGPPADHQDGAPASATWIRRRSSASCSTPSRSTRRAAGGPPRSGRAVRPRPSAPRHRARAATLELRPRRRRPGRRRASPRAADFLFFLVYLGLLVVGGSLPADPLRPGRPGGRATRSTSCTAHVGRAAARDLHAAQHEPPARSSGWRSTTRRRCPSRCPAARSRWDSRAERSWVGPRAARRGAATSGSTRC